MDEAKRVQPSDLGGEVVQHGAAIGLVGLGEEEVQRARRGDLLGDQELKTRHCPHAEDARCERRRRDEAVRAQPGQILVLVEARRTAPALRVRNTSPKKDTIRCRPDGVVVLRGLRQAFFGAGGAAFWPK